MPGLIDFSVEQFLRHRIESVVQFNLRLNLVLSLDECIETGQHSDTEPDRIDSIEGGYTRRAVGMIRKTTSPDDTWFCVLLFGFTEIFNPGCTRLFECGANRIARSRGSARGLSPRRGLSAAAGD